MSHHNVLAIDTSTEACSAALSVGGRLFERREIAPRRHAELILPMIESLLAQAGIGRHELDGIAVGRGPGAFTGVRLGVSVAQGLALGLDLPVVAVSSLAALAMAAPSDAPYRDNAILAVIDARMGEVYAGMFVRSADGLVEALTPETVGPVARLILPDLRQTHGLARTQWSVVGTGWTTYAADLAAVLQSAPDFADGGRYPQAADVLRLAAAQFVSGAGVVPEAALPVYLRDKVALTLDEQRSK